MDYPTAKPHNPYDIPKIFYANSPLCKFAVQKCFSAYARTRASSYPHLGVPGCLFVASSYEQQVSEMTLEHVAPFKRRASWPGVSASPVSKFDVAACAAPKTAHRSAS